MRTFISFISFIFSTQLLLAQAGKPTVAILDFEGQDVSESEVQTLSERMRTEIGNTNAVRLIERKAVERLCRNRGCSSPDVHRMSVRRKWGSFWESSS